MDHFEGLVPKTGQGTGGRQAEAGWAVTVWRVGDDQREWGGQARGLLPSPASPQALPAELLTLPQHQPASGGH